MLSYKIAACPDSLFWHFGIDLGFGYLINRFDTLIVDTVSLLETKRCCFLSDSICLA